MTAAPASRRIETASPLRRGVTVWYAVFGGVGAWTVHLMYLVCAEHWTHVHHQWAWTLNAVHRRHRRWPPSWPCCWPGGWSKRPAAPTRPDDDDAGQLLFLGPARVCWWEPSTWP